MTVSGIQQLNPGISKTKLCISCTSLELGFRGLGSRVVDAIGLFMRRWGLSLSERSTVLSVAKYSRGCTLQANLITKA